MWWGVLDMICDGSVDDCLVVIALALAVGSAVRSLR